MNKTKYKAFTLIEIIAVISLLIVISSIAVPSYIGVVKNQKLRLDLSTSLQLSQMAKTYYIETGNTDAEKLKAYLQKNYDTMPKSKSNDAEFQVTLNTNGKVSVTDGTTNFITDGVENSDI